MSHTEHHRAASGHRAACHIITCSDTRTPETDVSGQLIVDLLTTAGHSVVARDLIPDTPERLRTALAAENAASVVLITGGTGLAARDTTYDTLSGLYDSPIPGFGELFRLLSYQEIGTAAMLSRASAGRLGTRVVFSMPGSVHAVRLAMERLILPELAHVVRERTR